MTERYLKHYKQLLGGQNFDDTGSWEFDNLVKLMTTGLPATDWVPPLLRYYDRFKADRLTEFLQRLDNKFSADWLASRTPTDRIAAMNAIIQKVDDAQSEDEVFASDVFGIDEEVLRRTVDEAVYGRRYAKYLVMKLDYLYQNHDQHMHFETISVEHILPQNPEQGSQWVRDFTPEQRAKWTDKLGNLVLITCRKNSSQGRLDFTDKVSKYFQRNIDMCPNSLRVFNTYKSWTPTEVEHNHSTLMKWIREHYGLA